MANWNLIKSNVKTAANKAIKTTGELADLAKMHLKLKALEGRRDKRYTELGRLTYRQIKTGESFAERIAPIIDELDVVRERIRQQNQLIEETKKARAEEREARREQ